MVAANREKGMPGDAPRSGGVRQAVSGIASSLAVICAAPLALIAAVLAVEDAFELGSKFLVTVLSIAFVVLVGLLIVGLRGLRQAQKRTGEAVDRAVTAEAIQRSRADELARVLKAAESLALAGEGQVDYLSVLEAITPDGATSFLVRVEGETDGLVAAAHGPLASSVVGTRRPLAGPRTGQGLSGALVTSFSASGHHVGVAVAPEHIAGAEAEIEAALTIVLTDHDGHSLGWLHMLDHRGERVLEPGFVNLAQLVANQIGVAMENSALLGRLRLQLVEVQRVQQQLIQVSKLGAVGELAAAVAHEVNNPLTGILGFAELLMDELPEDDPRHDEASVIRDEAVRARSIVKALLEFARPRQPQRIPTNLNDLARSALELVRFRAADGEVRMVADYGDLPCLEIDADAFRQVLLNLFNNAIDAMPRGGTLRVATMDRPDRVGVLVSYEGVGMDEETQSRIFTPFFSTRAGNGGGNGLGLSVSLQIIEGHGGSIAVESTPGRGSTFTVWLPRSVSDFSEGKGGAGGAESDLDSGPAGASSEAAATRDKTCAPGTGDVSHGRGENPRVAA
jgi:signal transduction histidine kinase